MKIAYFAWIDTSKESGVLHKITRQMRAWQQRGVEVKLFALSSSTGICDCLKNIPVESITCSRIRNGLVVSRQLFSKLLDWKPDVIYYRFLCYFPFLPSIMKNIPTFLEIVTNDLAEYKVTYPRIIYLYQKFTRNLVL